MDKKADFRNKILQKLRHQKEALRLKKSRSITAQLYLQPEFIEAVSVFFYIATKGEVDTAEMIRGSLAKGKRVVVPVTMVQENMILPSELKDLDSELEKGPFGILQPRPECIRQVPLKDIGLAVVPGVAFDESGNRLGRGGGYFDRFLSRLRQFDIPIFGLAFSFQIVTNLPVLPHDIPVTRVLSA